MKFQMLQTHYGVYNEVVPVKIVEKIIKKLIVSKMSNSKIFGKADPVSDVAQQPSLSNIRGDEAFCHSAIYPRHSGINRVFRTTASQLPVCQRCLRCACFLFLACSYKGGVLSGYPIQAQVYSGSGQVTHYPGRNQLNNVDPFLFILLMFAWCTFILLRLCEVNKIVQSREFTIVLKRNCQNNLSYYEASSWTINTLEPAVSTGVICPPIWIARSVTCVLVLVTVQKRIQKPFISMLSASKCLANFIIR